MARLILAYSWLIVGLLLVSGCSHGPWIVDLDKCDPGPSHLKLCHKVQEYKD